MRLQNRGIIITGAGQGLGRAIAEGCRAEGAHVPRCVRSPEPVERTRVTLDGQTLIAKRADASRPEDVPRLFATARQIPSHDGVANNAAALGRRSRYSVHGAAKPKGVRPIETPAEEEKGIRIGIDAISLGAMSARLFDAVPEATGPVEHRRALKEKQTGAPPEKAADLCSLPPPGARSGITGRRFGADWDSWEQLPQGFSGNSRTTERGGSVFPVTWRGAAGLDTRRRIVPKDRGLDSD